MNIILASASKRRSKILSSCGITHRVVRSNVREIKKGKFAERIAMVNALLKAATVAKRLDSGYVIGADTVVKLGRSIMGKPRDEEHAKNMLKAMSGRTVFVYTGLCLIDVKRSKLIIDYEKSEVRVKKIRTGAFPRYFGLLGPYDKAGGFSIEGVGSFIFDDIKGSYFNVLGLPTLRLNHMFEKLGVDILKIVKANRC